MSHTAWSPAGLACRPPHADKKRVATVASRLKIATFRTAFVKKKKMTARRRVASEPDRTTCCRGRAGQTSMLRANSRPVCADQAHLTVGSRSFWSVAACFFFFPVFFVFLTDLDRWLRWPSRDRWESRAIGSLWGGSRGDARCLPPSVGLASSSGLAVVSVDEFSQPVGGGRRLAGKWRRSNLVDHNTPIQLSCVAVVVIARYLFDQHVAKLLNTRYGTRGGIRIGCWVSWGWGMEKENFS